jgi:hypothetical protein
MSDSVELPTVPPIPPPPAPDAPAEHHAHWLEELFHYAKLAVHDGVLVVESPLVRPFLSPQAQAAAAVLAIVDTSLEGASTQAAAPATTSTAPAVAAPASPDSSTPAGA